MVDVVFSELAILLFMSVTIGYLAIRMRQPLVLSFIVVGIIAGPSFLGWITYLNQLKVLASFGVTLLLFIVGLKMDLDLIKTFGVVTLTVGLGQIIVTTLLGFLLGMALGFPREIAFFIAMVLT